MSLEYVDQYDKACEPCLAYWIKFDGARIAGPGQSLVQCGEEHEFKVEASRVRVETQCSSCGASVPVTLSKADAVRALRSGSYPEASMQAHLDALHREIKGVTKLLSFERGRVLLAELDMKEAQARRDALQAQCDALVPKLEDQARADAEQAHVVRELRQWQTLAIVFATVALIAVAMLALR